MEADIARKEQAIEQKEADFKNLVFALYVQALQFRNVLGNVLGGESKVPLADLWEYYPDLFESPEAQEEREAVEFQMYLDERDAAIERFNERFRQREAVKDIGRNDTGETERDPGREPEAVQAGDEVGRDGDDEVHGEDQEHSQ